MRSGSHPRPQISSTKLAAADTASRGQSGGDPAAAHRHRGAGHHAPRRRGLVQVAAQTGRGMTILGPNRSVHPLAWWAWAACLAVSAMQTIESQSVPPPTARCGGLFRRRQLPGQRPLVAGPWPSSCGSALVVIIIRVVIEIFFGERGEPGHVLFTHASRPAAVLGGGGQHRRAVTLESMVTAAVLGLQIAVILVCFGAANSLRQSLPAASLPAGRAL